MRYSLDQGTPELLFVPVSPEVRARVKAYIDVLVQRFAKSVAAILLLTVSLGWVTPIHASWFGLSLIVLWTGQTLVARRHYVAAFREGLLAREIDPAEGLDRSSVHTLEAIVEALGSEDRDEVLHALKLLEVQERSNLVPTLLLVHEDPGVRSATLRILVRKQCRSARRHIENLLADPDPGVRAEAVQALALLTGTEEPQVLHARLRNADSHVRAAAVASLLQRPDSEYRNEALAALQDMTQDARPETRVAAASALAEVPAEEAVHPFLRFLYDKDTTVIKAALASVTRQVSSDGKSVLFAPVLISLLRDRRLKHEAREALVASGEDVIPPLNYFLNDPVELPWVRRALPKTISRFGSAAAQKSLVDSLPTQDLFLKQKIIQALDSLRSEVPGLRFDRSLIDPQILEQSRLYLTALSRLASLSGPGDFEPLGIESRWALPSKPSLLQHLLIDRMKEHLENLFGLLALVYRGREVWSSYDRLRAAHGATRGHALEYLDNSLRPSVQNHVLAVLDDLPLKRRLDEARRLFDIRSAEPTGTLRQLIESAQEEDPIALWIGRAAVNVLREDQVEELYPLLRAAAQQGGGTLMAETATLALRTLKAA